MDSDENRMEFFYYEDCECGIAITHDQTIIAHESYIEQYDEMNVKSEFVLLYLFNFVNSDEIDWWID
jgi:hypothetical protein